MGVVGLTRAVASGMWPEVAYQSPEVNDAGHRLFIAEQKGLMAGEEIGLAQFRLVSASMPMAR